MEDKAVVKLFKEQLDNEIETLVKEMGLETKGQGFIWWYFKKLVSLSDDEIEEIYCDGSGDLGIDVIRKDRNEIVHFYQFKNRISLDRGFPTGDVDKTLSGLRLIMSRRYEYIANDKLKDLVDEVLETIPSGYKLHFVSSSNGLEDEAIVKVDEFIDGLAGFSEDYFTYDDENINVISDRFYNKTLPTLDEKITIQMEEQPYMVRIANHDSYLFHSKGINLAEMYDKHGEKLLQQNIRMYEGENPTNETIYRSCSGEDHKNFYHYNNGITILCDEAIWEGFTKSLTIKRPQIVNGGQTVRILHKALIDGKLDNNVDVVVRTITSQGDKQFAGNVAVNLNNQTRVESSFLKSNDPRIVQLGASLKAIGYYLERRQGEIDEMSDEDRTKIEITISGSLDEKKIPLKEGTQAYFATFDENAGIARMNPGKMFLSVSDGGFFEKIFDSEFTAEDFAKSYELYKCVFDIVKVFKSIKRRKKRITDYKKKYGELLGNRFIRKRMNVIEQIIPQSTIFITGLCYQYYIINKKYDWNVMLEELKNDSTKLSQLLDIMIDCQEKGGDDLNKTWQTLLKSQEFFSIVSRKIMET